MKASRTIAEAARKDGQALSRDRIAELLTEARARTLLLVSPLSDEDLARQHDPLMSPIVWDLGHIAEFEDLWLRQNLTGASEYRDIRGMFDPFENPRATRAQLPLPSRSECLDLLASVRRAVLEGLEEVDFTADDPLLRESFVFRMVLQHEYQHNETILQTLQLKQGEPYTAPRGFRTPEAGSRVEGMARFPGGAVRIGTEDRSAAYDNERGEHEVVLDPFEIDRAPVTNGDFADFIAADGYGRAELWSEAGWRWREENAEIEAPKYWFRADSGWHHRTMDRTEPVDPHRPVCHICYYEAEAYARHAGKRLPTEVEWEAAATWDPESGTRRRFPWGNAPPGPRYANLDQLAFGTAPVGAYPRNTSPIGCYGMIGDVWEWTSSDFGAYPEYETFPYPEYSEVFFGDEYKVLRGGSWATRPGAIRSTFRNWDYPIRRQIFAGLRCARDV